jgi:Fe2+ transport system protein FeoA
MINTNKGLYRWLHPGRWHRRVRPQLQACVDGELVLSGLPDGALARILCLRCGDIMTSRLDAMGLVPGAVIEKRSSSLNRGPVLVAKGPMQLALAYDVAERIVVESVG